MNLAIFGQRIRTLSANVLAVSSAVTLTCGLWTHDASADNRVGEFITSATDWTYAPVITRLPNGSGTGGAGNSVITVDNILAVAKPGVANGENLIAVWYVRETSGGTTWAAKTWEDTTWPGIAQRLKDDLGLTDQELEIFGQGPTGSAAASAPANYTGGFIEGDPMIQIVNDADPTTREMLVDILKDVGYKIADPVFDEKDDCGRDAKLNKYAFVASDVLSQHTKSELDAVAALHFPSMLIESCSMKPFVNSYTPILIPGTFVPLPSFTTFEPWGQCPSETLTVSGIPCKDYKVVLKGKARFYRVGYPCTDTSNRACDLQICEQDCQVQFEGVIRCCKPNICVSGPADMPCETDEIRRIPGEEGRWSPDPDYGIPCGAMTNCRSVFVF